MADEFAGHGSGLDSPATRGAAVTPSDDTDLATAARGLWVGVAGNVKVTTVGGDEITFVGVAAGGVVPARVSRVWSTGTTATDILALW